MAFTKRSDIVIPEVLAEAIQGEFAGKTLLNGSGVAVQSNTLPYRAGTTKGGDRVKMPYFGTLGEADDITNEGDALTPDSITEDSDTAAVIHTGKAIETSDWARFAAAPGADPHAEAGRQMAIVLQRRIDKALIDVATASLAAAFINDVTSTPGLTLNYDIMVDSVYQWGDQQEAIRMLAVHSKVYKDLLKLKDSTGKPLLVMPQGPADVPMFMGVPVKVSDKCKAIVVAGSPTKYESMILKEAAVACWGISEPIVKTGEDILSLTDLAAVHYFFAPYRYRRVRGSTQPGVIKIVTF